MVRNTRQSAGAELFGGGNVNRFSGEPSVASASYSDAEEAEEDEPVEQGSPRRRVTEDISDLTKSISSKFWGVASFLASPSPSQTVSSVSSSIPRACSSSLSSPSLSHWQHEPTISGDSDLLDSFELSRTAGIRSDFAEIGGTLKTGIRRLSNSGAINGISKMAFNFLSLGEEVKDYENEQEEKDEVEDIDEFEDEHVTDVIGVTDEVLAFAGNIACHPETWLDFPLLSEDDDFLDDFDMSVAQQDHALVIESLVPRLAALRIELCPTHMSIWCFWKIYFALLHPRLNKHDADLLSTPQIVDARAMLLHGLQCQEKQESEDFMRKAAYKDSDYDTLITPEQFSTPWATQGNMSSKLIRNLDMETLSAPAADSEFVDKFVVKEEPLQTKAKDTLLSNLDEEEDDDWPEDETQDVHSATLLCNEEDISFSDLEDSDHSYNFSKGFKAAAH